MYGAANSSNWSRCHIDISGSRTPRQRSQLRPDGSNLGRSSPRITSHLQPLHNNLPAVGIYISTDRGFDGDSCTQSSWVRLDSTDFRLPRRRAKMFTDAESFVTSIASDAALRHAWLTRGLEAVLVPCTDTLRQGCRYSKVWVDGWGIFGHLDADVVIKKITDIIMDNSVKPEQWAMTEEGFDESWMPIEVLREP
ncbi:hypothetical protein B0H14DRAFT_664062 [Mycena olivaceomarginata]|nr:hypothetical protein B0H14DRAFT_664062 [Mycena olivaceomarginata]